MTQEDLTRATLASWRRHNEIQLFLVKSIPKEGFGAKPTGSRGRSIARQFEHVERVRRGWLEYQTTGKRTKMPRADTGPEPSREELLAALSTSGRQIQAFLGSALAGDAKVRMFGGNPMRFLGYLISHESHHRGSIMLALKQNGMRQKEDVALDGLWGRWMNGADEPFTNPTASA